jgi:hypothetical protein
MDTAMREKHRTLPRGETADLVSVHAVEMPEDDNGLRIIRR